MYIRVKNVLRITEMFCIILILNILSSKYFTANLWAFFTHKFSSNTGTISCKFWLFTLSLVWLLLQIFNHWLKFLFEIFLQSFSFYLIQEIFMYSCKVLFLEIDCFNFQENILLLIKRVNFFSAGFCISHLDTSGGEVRFYTLSWKSNFVHMRRKI